MTTTEEIQRDFPMVQCSVAIGPGWVPLVRHALTRLAALGDFFIVDCIKEKYGGLRIYLTLKDGAPSDAWDRAGEIVTDAERVAYATCEECGKPGTLRSRRHWLTTTCLDHAGGRCSCGSSDLRFSQAGTLRTYTCKACELEWHVEMDVK